MDLVLGQVELVVRELLEKVGPGLDLQPPRIISSLRSAWLRCPADRRSPLRRGHRREPTGSFMAKECVQRRLAAMLGADVVG